MPWPDRTARQGVVLALAAAAGLHLAAFSQHLGEGVAVATFFLVVAALQLGAAAAVRGGISTTAGTAIVIGNVALVVLWAVSRTWGVPAGPHAGTAEPVGILDSLAVATEAIAIVGLLLVPGRTPAVRSRRRRPPVAVTASLVGVAALVLAPTTHGDHDHRLPSAPAVAGVTVPPPAFHAPGLSSSPSDDRARADATRRDADCTHRTECDHRHGHGDHAH
ncbi:MAG: hypothetical protein M3179_00445 [Actinomycetota bacterium]|nr:hypothetical protein [Actinomycetota bacterium]